MIDTKTQTAEFMADTGIAAQVESAKKTALDAKTGVDRNIIDPLKYYRFPWSLTDNGISWLEVTTSCNLECEGCYRPRVGGHKSLEEIADDLRVFTRERK